MQSELHQSGVRSRGIEDHSFDKFVTRARPQAQKPEQLCVGFGLRGEILKASGSSVSSVAVAA